MITLCSGIAKDYPLVISKLLSIVLILPLCNSYYTVVAFVLWLII